MTKKYSDLKAVVGHRNYYQSEKSGIIYYKDPLLGKFSTKETTIQRAKRAVDIRRQMVLDGKDLSSAKRNVMKVTNPPVKDIWDEYIIKWKAKNSAPNTMKNYNKSWTSGFGEFFKDRRVDSFNEKTLNDFCDWYMKNKSDRLVEVTVVHLKILIRAAFEKKIIKEIPKFKMLDELVELIDVKSNREKHERVYDEVTEVLPLLTKAKTSSSHEYLNARAYLAIVLGVRCGLRKGEVISLKKEYLDFENDEFKVRSTKNYTWRKVPMMPIVKEAFLWQLKFTGNSEFIFPMPSNPKKNISSQILDKCWNNVKEAAEIKGSAWFHDLRRTCATRMGEAGIVPQIASKILDHTVEEYMKTYFKPQKNSLKNELEKMMEYTKKQGELEMKKSST